MTPSEMKAPFKIPYSNGLTYIPLREIPYYINCHIFTKAILNMPVDKTTNRGIDVHMLQPGFGWVSVWRSKILPPTEHGEWLRKTYNLEYLLDGSDIMADFTTRRRKKSGSIHLPSHERYPSL